VKAEISTGEARMRMEVETTTSNQQEMHYTFMTSSVFLSFRTRHKFSTIHCFSKHPFQERPAREKLLINTTQHFHQGRDTSLRLRETLEKWKNQMVNDDVLGARARNAKQRAIS
jgi:hypothetical protein